MNGFVLYGNVAPDATLDVTSEASGFEKEFAVDLNQGTPWQSIGITTQYFKMTFPTAKTIEGVVLLGTNIEAGDTTLKLQGSNDDFSSTPLDQDLPKQQNSFYIPSSGWTYLAFRVVAVKDSGSYIEIKEILLFEKADEFTQNYGWDYDRLAERVFSKQKSYGGQIHKALIYKAQNYSLSFSLVSDSLRAILNDLADQVRPVIFFPDGVTGSLYHGYFEMRGDRHSMVDQNNIPMLFEESPA